jgi:hypothetical protein
MVAACFSLRPEYEKLSLKSCLLLVLLIYETQAKVCGYQA